jgi:hypothetical protein
MTNLTDLTVTELTVTGSGKLVGGTHTATSGEATAGTLDIDTGLSSITAFLLQIYRSDVPDHTDADVSVSGGTITVADGAATYAVTAGDVINWIAFGA